MEEKSQEPTTFFQLHGINDSIEIDDIVETDSNTYDRSVYCTFEKRRKTNTGYVVITERTPPTNTLQLSSGCVLRFQEQDGTNLLLPEWFESNSFVRKIVSRCLRPVVIRLRYMHKIIDEEEGYDDNGNMIYYDLKEQVMESYIVETRLRRAMRNVLMRWRNYRMDKQHQYVIDPITLSEPVKKVILYDWSMKRKFVFDAKSLAIHIETALLYHEGEIAEPHYPRNPWTNIDFTYRQLISIYEQLKIHGELRWSFITLRKHNFNIDVWYKYHHTSIIIHAIQTSLIQLDSIHAKELLEDFIITKIEEIEEVTPFIINLYRTAIMYVPTHWIIEKWKQIAFLYYEDRHFGTNRSQKINMTRSILLKKQPQLIYELVEKSLLSS